MLLYYNKPVLIFKQMKMLSINRCSFFLYKHCSIIDLEVFWSSSAITYVLCSQSLPYLKITYKSTGIRIHAQNSVLKTKNTINNGIKGSIFVYFYDAQNRNRLNIRMEVCYTTWYSVRKKFAISNRVEYLSKRVLYEYAGSLFYESFYVLWLFA